MTTKDTPDPLEALSLAIADGEDTDASDRIADGSNEARIAARLRELSVLRRVFSSRAAGAKADEPICPFDWGRLKVRAVIGQGSFARIFRAHDPVLDREVALKLFRHDRTDLDADQLIAEARQHARVHHPRVLAVHGADVDNGIAGLWTDLLEGEDLAQRLGNGGALGASRLRGLAADLSAGLAAVHEEGIIHGDLKPANVWLDRQERGILMDFGASEKPGGSTPARYGSPVTMAPELFAGEAPTPKSDLYALGAVLHFAATGTYPLTGNTIGDIREAHLARRRPDFSALRQQAPAEARFIESLLAARPEDRCSLDEVRAALDALAKAPQRRFRRRAIGALVASLALGLATALFLLQRTESARQEAETARASAEAARFEAQTSKDFLINSVRNMSPEVERGLGTVRAVLNFLDEFSDERLAETPLALGELKVVVGTRLTHFDEVERGLALAQQGIGQIEAVQSEPSRTLGVAYYDFAEAQRQASRYSAAIENGSRALAILERLEPTEELRYTMIQVRGMLVGIQGDLGNWTEQLALQRQQLADRATVVGEDDPRMAVEYNNLAQAFMANGRYAEALDAFSRCMQMIQAGETPRPFPEAIVTHSISVALLRMGRVDEAEIALEDARKRFVDLGTEPGDERFRRLDRTRAEILRAQGRLEDAIEIFEAQLQIESDSYPLQQRYNRSFLAYAYLEADRGEEALELLRGAREAYAWPEGHPERHFLDGAIAFAEATTGGDPAAAREVLNRSIAFFEDNGYGGTRMARDLRGWWGRLLQRFPFLPSRQFGACCSSRSSGGLGSPELLVIPMSPAGSSSSISPFA